MSVAGERWTGPAGNRSAKVSMFFAGFGIAALANFATGIAWINPPVFVALAMLCALAAIIAGHVGRFRGRRLDGDGRGMALLGIVLGWLLLLVCVLAVVAVLGLITGLAVLHDAAEGA
ncbi:small-conductance mechanosensitive channel [Actinomadura coerulea]|uniref:Small-conductance mechanosensitive channel n=1 Tax=Actinomadura coerulea TaxID=46159 RepID=A0A7X0L262_9ACTN|nr:DUF4190 domain-containing protein [Actinomadura coerulea]MBB6399240.1 small-conductance mechanosensitive channel [Actinomadura coerulea]GGQ24331.1 hypothetical protein GCM10010187_46150 [Actinomadura coerulea]